MPSKRKNNKDEHSYIKGCVFCGTDEVDEILFGKFIISDDVRIHMNCLFFASGLSQRGDESEEFFGFLKPDIESEIRRGRKLFCSYCRKRGATVGCCITSCKTSFHLNCGLRRGSQHEFFGTFNSYCKVHKPKQKKLKISEEFYCFICCESIEPNEVESCLYSPCCKKNLFHRFCLQKYALSAGLYFFKCPLCNNTRKFVKEMKMYGINIPHKDASWELEENAYEELLVRPECDAPVCQCPRGRNYCPQRKSGWTLVNCSYCGFHARHKNCENITSEDTWLCEECTAMNDKIAKSKQERSVSNEIDYGIIACSNNLCLSPKVVLENCLAAKTALKSGVYFDALPSSGSALLKVKADPVENIDISETIEFDNVSNIKSETEEKFNYMGTSEESLIAGPSIGKLNNQARKQYQLSTVAKITLNKLAFRAANFRDIKNVAHSSQTKQVKESRKMKSSRKMVKKPKMENLCANGSQSLITSYFGNNYEKNIRL